MQRASNNKSWDMESPNEDENDCFEEYNDYNDDDIYYDLDHDDGDDHHCFVTHQVVLNNAKPYINPNAIEMFEYESINIHDALKHLEAITTRVSDQLKIMSSISKLLLMKEKWNEARVVESYLQDKDGYLELRRIKPITKQLDLAQNAREKSCARIKEIDSLQELSFKKYSSVSENVCMTNLNSKIVCNVCLQAHFPSHLASLYCEHLYCKDCWNNYLSFHIENGNATNIECMSTECQILATEHFVHSIVDSSVESKYRQLMVRDAIDSHPLMRSCVGTNCEVVVRAKEVKAKRVVCPKCKADYCFVCGEDYHAPCECKVIRMWKTKCEDDSETANYISAHTKDCPNCSACIEKNGGCNHMKCYSCKHEFCWMCLDSWKVHGAQYYECSKFKEISEETNPENKKPEKARSALRKYLFYYDRWANHMTSLKLEDKTMSEIKDRVHEKVMASNGTWIDWQYLLDAGSLLARCRYTLKFTYPKAYFMLPGPDKTLFEYQQAQLEAEIENLSWKIEHAETTDRGDLENQMDIVEKRRTAILEDFYYSNCHDQFH